jgi:hypothetical protein
MDTIQETLRATSPQKPPAGLNKRRVNPTRLFVDRDRLAWWWFLCAGAVLIGAAVDRYYLVAAFRQQEHVVIIDPAGTYYVSPLLKFEQANELHAQQSTLATIALLQRNPEDFDQSELLKQMFLKSAHAGATFIRERRVQGETDPPETRDQPDRRPGNASRCSAHAGQRPAHPQRHFPGEGLYRSGAIHSKAQAPTQSQYGRERPVPDRNQRLQI